MKQKWYTRIYDVCYKRKREEDNNKIFCSIWMELCECVSVLFFWMVKESMADGVVNPFYSFPVYVVMCMCKRTPRVTIRQPVPDLSLPIDALYPIFLWHEDPFWRALYERLSIMISHTLLRSVRKWIQRVQENVSCLLTAMVCMQAKLYKFSIKSEHWE